MQMNGGLNHERAISTLPRGLESNAMERVVGNAKNEPSEPCKFDDPKAEGFSETSTVKLLILILFE
jgi:hypothetical protein